MLIGTQLHLRRALKGAGSYQEWSEAARAWDAHKGLDRWRRRDHSKQYDYVSIRLRLDRLRSLKSRHDNRGMLYTRNEGIHGNMAGMGRAGLYAHALSGTKHLIEDYIEDDPPANEDKSDAQANIAEP